ncbi:MAG: dihydrolipoyl dehydrogenase [Ruthenibacterium sp.]
MQKQFDLLVIGAGPGGYVAALEAAALGKTVALVESREVGGTCLNRGCIPTKALLRAAHIYHEAKSSEELGICASAVRYTMPQMHLRVAQVTAQLRGGIEALLARAGVVLLHGTAQIAARGTVRVGDAVYTADKLLLATGSGPATPPIPGMDLPCVVTSDALLTHGGIDCKKLVIVGGGVVGVEFAQIYNDLGCEVTILEALPRLLSQMDRELSQNLAMIFKKRGIAVHTAARVSEFVQTPNGPICRFTEKDAAMEVGADCILVCTGRTANTAGLLAPESALDLQMQRGFIPVDKNYETKECGIYAIGDIVLGGMQLAHAAEAAGKNAVHAMFGLAAAKDASVIPSCVFTRPEIACAGITADDAKAAGLNVTVEKHLTSANGRALIEQADRGFVKLVSDADSGRLLGAQLMCPHASEMVFGLTAAIANGMTAQALASTVFPHPTVSETIVG